MSRLRKLSLLLLLFIPGVAHAQAPVVFFTDLTSGPGTGGENNNGTILTIYGRNFGATRGTSTVTVGGGAVAAYLVWGGRSKAATSTAQLETISVAIGASAATGTVVVNTSSGASTCENTKDTCQFTVRTGNIKCVSTAGSDSNNGTFPSSCFATIPKGKTASVAGDITYVLNGVTASVQENFSAALAIINNTCTALAPCALVGYPGATATIGVDSLTYGIRNPAVAGQMSNWVIANFLIRGQTAFEPQKVDNYRIVNNDLSCPQGGGQSACMHTVQATNYFFYGNYTHNVGDQHGSIDKFYHGNYYTTDSNHIWAGWNEVDNNPTGSTTSGGCRAVQFFSTGGSDQFDLHIHDNVLHDSICDGLNFSTVNPDAGGTVEAYNNIIYHVGTGPDPANGASDYACIVAGGGITGTGAVQFYNNTMYDCGARKAADSGALFAARPLQMWNNITQQLTGELYLTSSSSTGNITGGSNNIWSGVSGAPSQTTGNITSDPKFVTAGSNFTLLSGSPALAAGTAAHASTWDFNGQPRGTPPTLGAFEPFTQTDIYLSQSATGSGLGTSCTNARAVSFFNASGNWGTTPGQIGSGVTVHLCGTITSTLIAPASQGTGLITIKFEFGASVQQPAAQSLIQITNKTNSYLITGTAPCGFISHVAVTCTESIKNTANGSPGAFANTVTNVVGMDFSGTTGAVTVQWLELGNLYQHTDPNDSAFTDGAKLARGIADDIMMGNLTMKEMVIHDTSWALAPNPRQVSATNPPVFTVANVEFYNNDHDIALGAACNPSCWSVVIHDNHSHAHNAWNTFANAYHHDGIHTFNEQRQASSVTVYNNLFEGPWDWNSTDPIFDQSALQNFSLFNNVFICTTACTGSPAALRQYGGGPNEFQANNTFIQSGIPRTGTVLYITVTAGGSGYSSSPTVTVAGSATATAAVSGGAVTQLTVTNPGSGYQFPPAVSFSGGGGSGATATASIGFSNGSGVELTVPASLPLASSNVSSMNNIVSGASQCFNFNSQVFAANSATSGLDYNICANYITSGNRAFNWNGTSTDLFNTWQTLSGEGIHSQMVGNGLLGADGTPQSGSPAIGSGTNLTSLCAGNLVPLCSDYNGLARPSSGNWNVGAIGNPPTGGTPLAALSQTSAAFFNQMVGTTTSIPIVVTLSNNGTAVLSITSLTLTGTNPTNFGQSNTCGSGIAAGTSCLITITFTPSALGPRSAILNVNDNASGSPHTVSLTGNGMKTISGTGTITGTGTVKVQ